MATAMFRWTCRKGGRNGKQTVKNIPMPTSTTDEVWEEYLTGETPEARDKQINELAWGNCVIKSQHAFREHDIDPTDFQYGKTYGTRGVRTVVVPVYDLRDFAALTENGVLTPEACKVIRDRAREKGAKVTGFDCLDFDWRELDELTS